jgi:acyl-coenzyme A synthetase/AMP-(fatty) acid ligase
MVGYLGEDRKAPPSEIRTGDRGWVDARGYLYLRDRMDSMVKLAGTRVYPAEVLNHLVALPGVRDAEVVARRAPDGEPALAAFVVLDGSEGGAEIRGRLARRIPGYMVPRWIVVRSDLPRLESGKPDRRRLRDEVPDDGIDP